MLLRPLPSLVQLPAILLFAALLLAAPAARAQTVIYRCTDAGGAVTMQNKPCGPGLQQQVRKVTVRERRLRWPVPEAIDTVLPGKFILSLRRRAKYLLFDTDSGTMRLHLGMSGSLRIVHPGLL